jgi:hypothetical protein
MSDDQEWRRLQELYAGLGDTELLGLARDKAGLTAVAQQVVDAEMDARGLQVPVDAPVEAMRERVASEEDSSVVELTTFQIVMDAETAMRALDDAGIPVSLEPAMRRLVDGGPLVKTNWLTIFVERERKEEAVKVLRERMGLFPVMVPEEAGDVDEGGEDEVLSIVGDFEGDDAEIVRKALTDADIWFQAEEEEGIAGTMIEVRPEDWERAMAVVEEAFGEG